MPRAVGKPIAVGAGPIGVGIDSVANQIYVSSDLDGNVAVIGIPFTVIPSLAPTGNAASTTWSSLFGPNGADFVGLFTPGSENTSPASRLFTNGTASPRRRGGQSRLGQPADPAGLAAGTYEVRLVSGAAGGTLARVTATLIVAANGGFTYIVSPPNTLTVPPRCSRERHRRQCVVAASWLQSNGSFASRQTPGLCRTDTFTYQAAAPSDLPSTATVSIAVTAAPVADNDTFAVVSGSVLNVPAPGVLANDTDADSPTLQARS